MGPRPVTELGQGGADYGGGRAAAGRRTNNRGGQTWARAGLGGGPAAPVVRGGGAGPGRAAMRGRVGEWERAGRPARVKWGGPLPSAEMRALGKEIQGGFF